MKSTLVSEASTDRHSAFPSPASDIYISKRLRAAKSDAAQFVSRRSRDPGFHDQEHRHTAVITPHPPTPHIKWRTVSKRNAYAEPSQPAGGPDSLGCLAWWYIQLLLLLAAAYIARWWLVADLEPGRLLCWPGDVAGPGPRNTSSWVYSMYMHLHLHS
jgi:hypothetical protein